EQPVAKRSAIRVVLQPANGPGNGAEHFLGQVGGVGVLQALLPRIAVHQRQVEFDKLPPRVPVVRGAPAEGQTGTGGGDLGHGSSRHRFPPSSTDHLRKPTTKAKKMPPPMNRPFAFTLRTDPAAAALRTV